VTWNIWKRLRAVNKKDNINAGLKHDGYPCRPGGLISEKYV